MDDWNKFGFDDENRERKTEHSQQERPQPTSGDGFIMRDTTTESEQSAQHTQNTQSTQAAQPQTIFVGGGNNGQYGQAGQSSVRKKEKSPYVTKRAMVVILIIAMVLSAAVGAGAYALAISTFGGTSIDKSISTTNYNLSKNAGSPLSIQEIVAKNENSVVAIVTESVSTDTWLGQYVTQGAGSGVIISKDGYIVTNNHVIDGASSIKVTLNNGKEYNAELVATDEQTDVAVIKIKKDNLTPVTFGDSTKLSIGDLAIAIGNPLGKLAGSATEGIISGLEREITLDGKTMNLIQTSASINPGNSGGGLFDQNGNLVGIVVAKSAGSEVEGLGFAIPSKTVQEIAKALMTDGYVSGRPAAGIKILDLTDAMTAMQYGVQITGVYISEVTGKNAKAAGLEPGDLVYYLDNEKITSGSQLVSLIQKHKVGDRVTFTVVRDNELKKISMELEEAATVDTGDDDSQAKKPASDGSTGRNSGGSDGDILPEQ